MSIICKNCGKELKDNAFICSKCGNVVNDNVGEKVMPKKKKDKLIIILVIILIIIALITCLLLFVFNKKDESNDEENYTQVVGDYLHGYIEVPEDWNVKKEYIDGKLKIYDEDGPYDIYLSYISNPTIYTNNIDEEYSVISYYELVFKDNLYDDYSTHHGRLLSLKASREDWINGYYYEAGNKYYFEKYFFNLKTNEYGTYSIEFVSKPNKKLDDSYIDIIKSYSNGEKVNSRELLLPSAQLSFCNDKTLRNGLDNANQYVQTNLKKINDTLYLEMMTYNNLLVGEVVTSKDGISFTNIVSDTTIGTQESINNEEDLNMLFNSLLCNCSSKTIEKLPIDGVNVEEGYTPRLVSEHYLTTSVVVIGDPKEVNNIIDYDITPYVDFKDFKTGGIYVSRVLVKSNNKKIMLYPILQGVFVSYYQK